MVRKRIIDTYDIVSAVKRGERKDIFCENRVSNFFLTCVIPLCR